MTLSCFLPFKCAAAAVLTGLSLAAAAGPITIANASFEAQTVPVSLGYTLGQTGVITGWTQSNNSSGLQKPSTVGGGANFVNGVTGLQTAYLNDNGSISQTLVGSSLQLGTYSLLVDVGDRADNFLALYDIELLIGSVELSIISQANPTPTSGWGTASRTYAVLDGNAFLGQALTIRLSRTGNSVSTGFNQLNFDNVRLTHDAPVLNNVPEPGSLVLVGLALAAAGTVASRRRHGGAAR